MGKFTRINEDGMPFLMTLWCYYVGCGGGGWINAIYWHGGGGIQDCPIYGDVILGQPQMAKMNKSLSAHFWILKCTTFISFLNTNLTIPVYNTAVLCTQHIIQIIKCNEY